MSDFVISEIQRELVGRTWTILNCQECVILSKISRERNILYIYIAEGLRLAACPLIILNRKERKQGIIS